MNNIERMVEEAQARVSRYIDTLSGNARRDTSIDFMQARIKLLEADMAARTEAIKRELETA
jgi:hypothetical protein